MYFEALDTVQKGWDDPEAMGAGVGVLLKSWHQFFYHFGPYDPAALVTTLADNLSILSSLRARTIDSLGLTDEPTITSLFRDFTRALRGGKNQKQEIPVATAKALHLLAPDFMPLWDNYIARDHGCLVMWSRDYIAFSYQMKQLAEAVADYLPSPDGRSALKRALSS